jgi:anti-sigma factor RsiW
MSGGPYITCNELITFLGDYLAHELPPEKVVEFERHLAVCESCVAYLATYQETILMARAAEAPAEVEVADVPEDLVKAILAVIR